MKWFNFTRREREKVKLQYFGERKCYMRLDKGELAECICAAYGSVAENLNRLVCGILLIGEYW